MLRTTQVKEASLPLMTVMFSIVEPKLGAGILLLALLWCWCWPSIPVGLFLTCSSLNINFLRIVYSIYYTIMTLYNRGRSMTQFSSGCWASPCTYVSLLCLNVQIRARPPCAQQLLAVYTRYKLVIKKRPRQQQQQQQDIFLVAL